MEQKSERRIEDCPYRDVHGSAAYCRLVAESLGVVSPELTLVTDDACYACSDSFVPSRRDPNSIVASLLYQSCETVIQADGFPGLSADKARELQQFAEDHLPAIREHEDESGTEDDVVELSGQAPIESVLPLSVRRHGRVSRWSVGVTTSPRRICSLDDTLEAIVHAGWHRPRIFSDGEVEIPRRWSDLPVTLRTPRVGAWPSYYLALTEMMMRDPAADAYVLFQDDIELLRRGDLREYLERALWPGDKPCIVSLYCSSEYTHSENGWHQFSDNWVWGATGFVFSPEAVRGILGSGQVLNHRIDGAGDGLKGIDVAIGDWARDADTPIWFPTPSLVQHTGQVSTLWDKARAVARRRAGKVVRAVGQSVPASSNGRRKLVLLSTGRCGTTLLQNALNQHSQIRMGGEPFCQDPRVNMFRDLIRDRFGVELPDHEMTTETRRSIMNGEYMEAVLDQVDGVSIHYWHLGLEFGPVDHYLLHRPDIVVLQLVRRNDFERFVSLQFAFRNKTWHTQVGQEIPEQRTLTVDPAEFLKSATRAEEDSRRYRDFFGDKLHTLYYEDVVSSWDESLVQIQQLLRVPTEHLEIRLKKSIQKPVTELVENYDEVREHCRNTLAEKYFD